MANANKTKPTDVSVSDYIATLTPRRQSEAHELVTMFQDITGLTPVMWGPSIIGFGSESYTYETGWSGNMPQMAFSPRKTALTIYMTYGFTDAYTELLARLGKHRTGVACLYINKLDDVDRAVLRELMEMLWRDTVA